MHRLTSAFVLAYHGCDANVAADLLAGENFKASDNDYDWLGPGVYFWESNPIRGLEYAEELKSLGRGPKINTPAVVGAVVDLGLCLDLTTSAGIHPVRSAHSRLLEIAEEAELELPQNSPDLMRRNLDCAVIRVLHDMREEAGEPPVDTVRGVFIEGEPAFDGSAIRAKTHVQVCVRNPACIKAVFRVPPDQLS